MGLLSGKRLVVISGIGKRAPDYKAVVESLGGEIVFLLPEDAARITAVSGDYVVFITGVMSHKAYNRILRLLNGDRSTIVYVNGTGITSFRKALIGAVTKASTDTG
jgi:hypothetical protein